MLLCCLLAVLLVSNCISAMPSMATTLDGPCTLPLHRLLPSSRMVARQARVVRSGNGSAALILI